jgi:hypothetical protein
MAIVVGSGEPNWSVAKTIQGSTIVAAAQQKCRTLCHPASAARHVSNRASSPASGRASTAAPASTPAVRCLPRADAMHAPSAHATSSVDSMPIVV